jgi:hypothetical protein
MDPGLMAGRPDPIPDPPKRPTFISLEDGELITEAKRIRKALREAPEGETKQTLITLNIIASREVEYRGLSARLEDGGLS